MMATGVTSFLTAPEASKALVPLGGALWLLDVPSAGGAIGDSPAPVKVAETNANEAAAAEGDGFDALPAGAPLLDAKLSADGSTVAFVCGEEVYAVVATAGPGGSRAARGAWMGSPPAWPTVSRVECSAVQCSAVQCLRRSVVFSSWYYRLLLLLWISSLSLSSLITFLLP